MKENRIGKNTLTISISAEDEARITRAAKVAGMSKSAYVRSLLMNQKTEDEQSESDNDIQLMKNEITDLKMALKNEFDMLKKIQICLMYKSVFYGEAIRRYDNELFAAFATDEQRAVAWQKSTDEARKYADKCAPINRGD